MAAFVFVLPVLFFGLGWRAAVHYWNPSWSHMSHDDYVMNQLFGPECGESECIGPFFTGLALPSVLYSLGALAVMGIAPRRQS